jgi:two-component sensor histidine kinase
LMTDRTPARSRRSRPKPRLGWCLSRATRRGSTLVTNCLKYAFPDDRPGTVVVKLSHDGSIHLVVEDDGVGCPKDARQGSGSVLMQLITRQLGGALRREGHNPGCRVEVDIPKD